jgi:hypothetical protein
LFLSYFIFYTLILFCFNFLCQQILNTGLANIREDVGKDDGSSLKEDIGGDCWQCGSGGSMAVAVRQR